MADMITIYHDGSCPLCRAEIAHYRQQQGAEKLAFVDVSAIACEVGPGLTARRAMGRFHIRLPDGSLRSGAAAFATIWTALPRWKWAAKVAAIPGMMPILELGYRMSLLVRPTLARRLTASRQ